MLVKGTTPGKGGEKKGVERGLSRRREGAEKQKQKKGMEART